MNSFVCHTELFVYPILPLIWVVTIVPQCFDWSKVIIFLARGSSISHHYQTPRPRRVKTALDKSKDSDDVIQGTADDKDEERVPKRVFYYHAISLDSFQLLGTSLLQACTYIISTVCLPTFFSNSLLPSLISPFHQSHSNFGTPPQKAPGLTFYLQLDFILIPK